MDSSDPWQIVSHSINEVFSCCRLQPSFACNVGRSHGFYNGRGSYGGVMGWAPKPLPSMRVWVLRKIFWNLTLKPVDIGAFSQLSRAWHLSAFGSRGYPKSFLRLCTYLTGGPEGKWGLTSHPILPWSRFWSDWQVVPLKRSLSGLRLSEKHSANSLETIRDCSYVLTGYVNSS